MRQKGFATIFSLWMILAIALVFKGIQESEMNYAYETEDFQAEFELQSAADSGIYAAAAKVQADKKENIETLTPNPWANASNRKNYQIPFEPLNIKSKHLGDIKVSVWGERLKGDRQAFQSYTIKNYSTGERKTTGSKKSGYTLLSVAETTSKLTGKKIYRRAFAYVLDSDATKIHFMELP